MKSKTLREKVWCRVKRAKEPVFLTNDFSDLSSSIQVCRVLSALCKELLLIRLGKGIYVKTKKSCLTGRIVPVVNIIDAAKIALIKLGVKVLPSSAEIAYNTRRSTQVPTGRVIGVNKKVTRKIKFNGCCIGYEIINERNKTMHYKIKSIVILPDYKIKALFDGGVAKIYDFNRLIQSHKAFEPLRDKELFDQATLDCGGYGISWTDDLDIDASEIWNNGVLCTK